MIVRIVRVMGADVVAKNLTAHRMVGDFKINQGLPE